MESIKTNSKGIKYSSTTDTYGKESDLAKGERNDCFVRSVASAFDIEYDDAHKFVEENFNRKPKKGTKGVSIVLDNLKEGKIMGHNVSKVTNTKVNGIDKLMADRKRRGETTKVRYTVGRFLRDFTEGKYIVLVRKHAFTVIDGTVFGNTDDAIKTSTIIENVFAINKIK